MGIVGLWKWLEKKGVSPTTIVLGHTLPEASTRHKRVDLQGAYFPTIRWAYGSLEADKAHEQLEKEILRLGEKDDVIIYVDGDVATEKESTHEHRSVLQAQSLVAAEDSIKVLDDRLSENKRVTRAMVSKARQDLQAAFVWSPEAKSSFVDFMRERDWHIIICDTEADVEIARNCGLDDVVVTRDSDLLAYSTVQTIWRLIGKGRVLQYSLASVLATTKLSQAQFTSLCIVSSNDYNKNLPQLGPETNFAIIKKLSAAEDVPTLVQAYLEDDRVVRASQIRAEDFSSAVRVFHDMRQTKRLEACKDDRLGHRGEETDIDLLAIADHGNTSADIHALADDQQIATIVATEALPDSGDTGRVTYSSLRDKFQTALEMLDLRDKQFWESKKANGTSTSSGTPRHLQPKNRNRYRTPRPLQIPLGPKQRPAYAFRHRTQRLEHDPPPAMVQNKWKGYKEPPKLESPTKPKKSKTPIRPPMTKMSKKDLQKQLAFEHPLSTLAIGTLQGKVNDTLIDEPELRQVVIDCIRHAARIAWDIKLRCQQIIGQFLEHLFATGHQIQPSDRIFLDALCERLSPAGFEDTSSTSGTNSTSNEENEEEIEQLDAGNSGKQQRFLLTLATFVYSGTRPTGGGEVVAIVNNFISRIQAAGFLPNAPLSHTCPVGYEYRPSDIARAAAIQIKMELRRHYHYGSKVLFSKMLPSNTSLGVDFGVSAIENFVKLNRLAGYSWRLCPLSKVEVGYLMFSESELMSFFWRQEQLKVKLQEMARPLFPNPPARGLPLIDVQQSLPIGRVIKEFIADVDPQGLSSRQRRRKGVVAAIKIWTAQDTVDHVNALRRPDFNPATYNAKGYIPSGCIRTDGHKLQLLAFKLKELQSVRFRRYSESKLPPRLLSTVGGTDYFLSEIRHVLTKPGDVSKLFGCPVEEIKILALDLGQACVVGSSLLLPESNPDPGGDEVFHNQAVKTKAVMQPAFKLRRWMNDRKRRPLDNPNEGNDTPDHQDPNPRDHQTTGTSAVPEPSSIEKIESNLPPLTGRDGSIAAYLAYRDRHQHHLNTFYNDDNFVYKKHVWDAKRAKQEEYSKIANALLNAVGGSIGQRRAEDNHVVIAIGLSRFQTKAGLTSLDESFSKYFIGLCPRCENFVGKITFRRLHCSNCRRRYHRDSMAAANMCNIVRSYLQGHGRPKYLQPVRCDGSLPWEDQAKGGAGSGGSISSNAGASGTSSASSLKSNKRRAPASAEVDAKKKRKAKPTTGGSKASTSGTNSTASSLTPTNRRAPASAEVDTEKRKTKAAATSAKFQPLTNAVSMPVKTTTVKSEGL
ncbi:Rad2 nuclease [Actinomortierella ambigua]|nr:Rad2 nuclease [Actinomortierella ambigua]